MKLNPTNNEAIRVCLYAVANRCQLTDARERVGCGEAAWNLVLDAATDAMSRQGVDARDEDLLVEVSKMLHAGWTPPT